MLRIASALLLLVQLQTLHAKDPHPAAVGVAMATAAQQFLASLNAEEADKATMDFDDPARVDWHNIPKPTRKGLPLDAMSPAQRDLCHKLLQAALSDPGYDKAVKIMALENNLREGEKGQGPVRDPDLYYLTIFGKPAPTGTWGWSFEGHHLSLNFVIRDGLPICDSPSFWGANPATVKVFVEGGPDVGTRTLAAEEQLAFDLINSLDASQQAEAIVADKAPADYRAPGQPQPPHTPPVGLAAARMSDAQQHTLLSLLEAYNSHLEPGIARQRLAAIKAAGLDRVHFAWSGATKPGVGHYYRVQGPTFVLELVNIQSDPAGNPANHIHSVWRSLQGDFAVPLRAKTPTPLPNAHAHNDYLHRRPLLDALDHGFTSVEADIFLVDGELLVAHERATLKPHRTLEALYLAPLAARVRQHGGRVHPDGERFFLLIDIKSDPEPTYARLAEALAAHADMFTTVEGDVVRPGAVTVVITGNRPTAEMLKAGRWHAGLDGRPADLDSNAPAHFMPMISDRWSAHFTWTGQGPMPPAEQARLKEMTTKAHAAGRVLRFWATPENEALWQQLRTAGVDLINTDQLARLAAFLSRKQP